MFWKTIKPHFTEKHSPAKKITLLESDKIISDDSDIAEVMNEFFTNIVDSLGIEGFPTKNFDYNFGIDHIANITSKFKEHPSILNIKEHPSILNIKEHPSILNIKEHPSILKI